ncbi:MAG: 30S ribosomal protein S8 [bacterium]|nr:30S ribosomal protein S8 [bacterium]
MTDPISDMLTRIRNALAKRHEVVEVPFSKMKIAIAEIFKNEGYIKDFHTADWKGQGKILIHLKYVGKEPAIIGLKRVSSPGRRRYVGYQEVKPVFNGTGVGVISTPKGILTDAKAREMKLGGEHLLNIW